MIVTDAMFSAEVERSPLPMVLDMWAAWCGPCQRIAPVIDELASEMAERLRFAKLNVDENPAKAASFNLRSIPTLWVLKAGQEVDRIVGVQPKSEIARRLERVTAGWPGQLVVRVAQRHEVYQVPSPSISSRRGDRCFLSTGI